MSVLLNTSEKSPKSTAPFAEYFPGISFDLKQLLLPTLLYVHCIQIIIVIIIKKFHSGLHVLTHFNGKLILSASEEAKLLAVDFQLEVLCFAAKDLPVLYAISKLIIPALVDQLNSMKKAILPNLLTQHPKVMQPI